MLCKNLAHVHTKSEHGESALMFPKFIHIEENSIMLFDSPEPECLILLRHFDEVPQALLEFVRTFARRIDEGDADADV
jgi:hypothetical protein